MPSSTASAMKCSKQIHKPTTSPQQNKIQLPPEHNQNPAPYLHPVDGNLTCIHNIQQDMKNIETQPSTAATTRTSNFQIYYTLDLYPTHMMK